MSTKLPLNGLWVFAAVMRCGSFRAAAEDLKVTPAAVSSQIRTLEDRLGIKLFGRKPGVAQPTALARRLYPDLARGLETVSEALLKVQPQAASGEYPGLNITLLPSFLQLWLLPRLPEFQKIHPQVELRFCASQTLADLSQGDFHAAIRFGRGSYAGLESEKLLDDWLLPVCAPELLEGGRSLNTFGELQRYPLLHSEHDPWSDWLRRLGGDTTRPLQGVSLDDGGALLQGVRSGQGIALMRWSLVASELQAGRLTRAMNAILPMEDGYWFVHAPKAPGRNLGAGSGVAQRLTLFRDWLFAQAAEFARPGMSPVTITDQS